ncbi:MAG: hypothetical protein NTV86_05265 [Planctomycetota bacterium]|nr:hypothetical protein [Planctomycetota bacterium]
MHIERHVFGSFTGYATLARSPGATSDDCRILESAAYSFGQSYDERFYKNLLQSPSYFTRVLRGGRRSLTRVLEGAPDDNGRPTLRMVSLILSKQDWDGQLCGDVGLLLADSRVWQWDGSGQIAAIDLPVLPPTHSIPRKYVPRVLALLSVIERGYTGRQGHVVTAGDISGQEMACLEMLIPPSARGDFTTAYRSLSPELPATVNCLATEAGSQNRITFRFKPDEGPLSPYSQYLHDSGLASGSIPLETIMAYTNFGKPPAQSSGGSADVSSYIPPTVVQRASIWPTIAVAMLAVLLSVGTFVATQLLSDSRIRDCEQRLARGEAANVSLKKECDSIAASNSDVNQKLQMAMAAVNKPVALPSQGPTTAPSQQGVASPSQPHDAKTAILEATTKRLDTDLKQTRDELKKLVEVFCKSRKARCAELSKEASDALARIDGDKKLPPAPTELISLQTHLAELTGEWTLEDNQKKSLEDLKKQIDAVVLPTACLGQVKRDIEMSERVRKSVVEAGDDGKTRDTKVALVMERSGESSNTLKNVPDQVRQINLKPQREEYQRRANELLKWAQEHTPKKK